MNSLIPSTMSLVQGLPERPIGLSVRWDVSAERTRNTASVSRDGERFDKRFLVALLRSLSVCAA
jgi:hypothetical protein